MALQFLQVKRMSPQWATFDEDGQIHVVPMDTDHELSEDCWCDPEEVVTLDGSYLLHRRPS